MGLPQFARSFPLDRDGFSYSTPLTMRAANVAGADYGGVVVLFCHDTKMLFCCSVSGNLDDP